MMRAGLLLLGFLLMPGLTGKEPPTQQVAQSESSKPPGRLPGHCSQQSDNLIACILDHATAIVAVLPRDEQREELSARILLTALSLGRTAQAAERLSDLTSDESRSAVALPVAAAASGGGAGEQVVKSVNLLIRRLQESAQPVARSVGHAAQARLRPTEGADHLRNAVAEAQAEKHAFRRQRALSQILPVALELGLTNIAREIAEDSHPENSAMLFLQLAILQAAGTSGGSAQVEENFKEALARSAKAAPDIAPAVLAEYAAYQAARDMTKSAGELLDRAEDKVAAIKEPEYTDRLNSLVAKSFIRYGNLERARRAVQRIGHAYDRSAAYTEMARLFTGENNQLIQRALLADALNTAQETEPAGWRAQAILEVARVQDGLGHREPAKAIALAAASAAYSETNIPRRAEALAGLCLFHIQAENWNEAAAKAEEVLSLVRQIPDGQVRAEVLINLAASAVKDRMGREQRATQR